ncbi:MAG: aldehyde dehydrogenase family protein, partial [Alcaligenaceae bacterium]
MIVSINPATEAVEARLEAHTPDQVEIKLANAASAQRAWALRPIAERSALLTRVAVVLRRNRDAYALLITKEMGKPIAEAESEIEKSAWTCDFYAESAAKYLGDQQVSSNAAESA